MTPAEEFLLSLERERFNVAYRVPAAPKTIEIIKPVPCTKSHNKPCTKEHVTESRDQMLFNAGRYAGGARDKNALEAHEALIDYWEVN